jgi:hypothetical protein
MVEPETFKYKISNREGYGIGLNQQRRPNWATLHYFTTDIVLSRVIFLTLE